MTDPANWIAFSEDKTSGWKAYHANGVEMEIWASIDEPKQFRITVGNILQPEFYPSREDAVAAAQSVAAEMKGG